MFGSTTYVNYDKITPCSQLYLGFTSSLFFTLIVLTEFMGIISAILPFPRSDSIFAARHKRGFHTTRIAFVIKPASILICPSRKKNHSLF